MEDAITIIKTKLGDGFRPLEKLIREGWSIGRITDTQKDNEQILEFHLVNHFDLPYVDIRDMHKGPNGVKF